MSAYGLTLYVSRDDCASLSEDEQATIVELIRLACERLDLTCEGDPVEPEPFDPGDEEPTVLHVLLIASVTDGQIYEKVQADDEPWDIDGRRIAAEIDKQVPGVYRFSGRGVAE